MKGNESKLHSKQVLIVDDNETNLKVLERMALTWNMQTTLGKCIYNEIKAVNTQANCGEVAVSILSSDSGNLFDYVLLDTQMPPMDGFAVAQFIKNSSKLRNIKIIMMLSSTALRGIVEQHAGINTVLFDH